MAWNLRRIRAQKGLSQERLAADCGVDRAYLSELEREQGNATIDLVDRLAGSLSVGLAELFLEPEAGACPPQSLRPGRRPG